MNDYDYDENPLDAPDTDGYIDEDGYFDETWDECPQCGAVFSGDEYINQRCMACGWKNGDTIVSEEDDAEP